MARKAKASARRVLIIGATGMLGGAVAKSFLNAGFNVRALVRDEAAARARYPGYEVVQGDVRDAAGVTEALKDCEAAFVSLRASSLAEARNVEVEGTSNVASAAARQGARMMYLSGAGLGEKHRSIPFAAIKLDAEARIRESGAAYTIFRPTHFMESLQAFVHGGRADVIGQQPHRYHYLAATDFGRMVTASVGVPEAAGQSLEIFGPQAFTMLEALQVYRRLVRPDIKVGTTPLPLIRALAFVTRSPQLNMVAQLFAAFNQIGEDGDPKPANALLGAPTTTLEAWCLAQAKPQNDPA